MQVHALDHVNILTYDLDATAGFYEAALGLTRGESLGTGMGFKGAWMFDASGHPLVHIGLKSAEGDYGPEHIPGTVTGAVHHIAFRCTGFDAAKARLESAGLEYRAMDFAERSFRQIVLRDPNNVSVELNFAQD